MNNISLQVIILKSNMEEKNTTKREKPGYIDPSEIDQDAYMRFAQAANSMTEPFVFQLDQANQITIMMILNFWKSRKTFGEDKKITLKLRNPKCPKQVLAKVFSVYASIQLYVDDEHIKNDAIMKNQEIMYYEGIQQNMFIFHKQTSTRYYGQVKSLTEIQPHGKGAKIEFPGTKDQIYYEGQFKDGKKSGLGVQRRKYLEYEGFWQNNQKHNWGRQLVRRKKKLTQKITEKKSNGSKSEISEQKSSKNITSIQQIGQEQQIKEVEEKKEIKQKDIQIQQKQEQIQQEQIKEQQQVQNQKHSLKQIPPEKIKQLLKQYRSIYEGPFQKGQKSGQDGTQYTRHSTYIGQWSCGVKSGKGKIEYKTGAKYEGDWKNNFIDGTGVYTDEAKNVYQGQFVNGLYDGQGVMKYSNGDQYTGTWSQAKKHGKGVYTYSDGDYYDGQWVRDSAQGQGSAMIGGVYFEGQYQRGQKNGLGEQTNEQGDTIKGIWRKNQRVETISINGQLVGDNS